MKQQRNWANEFENIRQVRKQAISDITAWVGTNDVIIPPTVAIHNGNSNLYGGLMDMDCVVSCDSGVMMLSSVHKSGCVYKEAPIDEIDTEALFLIASEIQKSI